MSVLSDQLVKEFVKITKDTPPKKTESFGYGTIDSIVEEGGQQIANVLFDGANTTTPCTLTVNAVSGDRVMVMIKNRQGVVTSNLSKPTINADYLEAGEATFTGTIHAATYEDSTGNFTMEIGSEEEQSGSVTPAFRIGGYVNGDPDNDYLEIEVTIYQITGQFPQLNISGTVWDEPNGTQKGSASIGIGETGIAFYASDGSLSASSSLPWNYNPG